MYLRHDASFLNQFFNLGFIGNNTHFFIQNFIQI